MICKDNCEWLEFKNNGMYCGKFDARLKLKRNKDIENPDLEIHRCEKCVMVDVINKNTDAYVVSQDDLKELSEELSWLTDGFYNFKDDFEKFIERLSIVFRRLSKNEKE